MQFHPIVDNKTLSGLSWKPMSTETKQAAKPKYLDLFSGCGGLSLGLERAGWDLSFAIEKSKMAGQTFATNILDMSDSEYERLLSERSLANKIAKGLGIAGVESATNLPKAFFQDLKVSLVVGGPPCQGFSLAGTRNSGDIRNQLPLQFIKMVRRVEPTFVVMENVVGMHSKFSPDEETTVYEKLAELLTGEGKRGPKYIVQKVLANAMHYGAAQSRPRLLLIACKKEYALANHISATEEIWKSSFLDELVESVPDLAPVPIHSSNRATVQDAFSDLIGYGDSSYTSFLKSSVEWKKPNPLEIQNHNFRKHSENTVEKLWIFSVTAQNGLPKEALRKNSEIITTTKFKNLLEGLNYPIISTQSINLRIEDSKHFRKLLLKHATKKHSQRVLSLTEPSPTVTTSPDDFIHPLEPRALTVREMARLQGFPDSFIFRSKETTGGLKRREEVPQYTQVGNAVSPFLAYAVGKKLISYLSK